MKLSNLIFCILIALFLILSVFNVWIIIKTNNLNKHIENINFELIRIHNEVSQNLPSSLEIILEDDSNLQEASNYKPQSWIKKYFDKDGNRISISEPINSKEIKRSEVEHIKIN